MRNTLVYVLKWVLVLFLLCAVAQARADGVAQQDEWSWRMEPFAGAGVTVAGHSRVSLNLGVEVGTFPHSWFFLGDRPFGGMIANVSGCTAYGLCTSFGEAAGLELWVGPMVWKSSGYKGDVVLFVKKDLFISW